MPHINICKNTWSSPQTYCSRCRTSYWRWGYNATARLPVVYQGNRRFSVEGGLGLSLFEEWWMSHPKQWNIEFYLCILVTLSCAAMDILCFMKRSRKCNHSLQFAIEKQKCGFPILIDRLDIYTWRVLTVLSNLGSGGHWWKRMLRKVVLVTQHWTSWH